MRLSHFSKSLKFYVSNLSGKRDFLCFYMDNEPSNVQSSKFPLPLHFIVPSSVKIKQMSKFPIFENGYSLVIFLDFLM